jgi:hypothetical protein
MHRKCKAQLLPSSSNVKGLMYDVRASLLLLLLLLLLHW